MEINITWNICRICLIEEQNKPQRDGAVEPMRHIFNEDKELVKQIYECSGITMKPNDNLPEKICKKCLIIIKHAVNFRKKCRASNKYLISILQRTRSAGELFQPAQLPRENILKEITNENQCCDDDDIAEAEQINPLNQETVKLKKSNKNSHMEADSSLLGYTTNILESKNEDDASLLEEEVKLVYSKSCFKKNFGDDYEETSRSNANSITNELTTRNHNDIDEDQRIEMQGLQDNYDDCTEGSKTTNIFNAKDDVEEHLESSENGYIHIDFITREWNNIDDNKTSYNVVTKDVSNDTEQQGENTSSSEEIKIIKTEYIMDDYLTDDSNSVTSLTMAMLNSETLNNQTKKTDDHKTSENSNPPLKNMSENHVWICDLCGNHFSNRQLLNAHMKIHRQEKRHECEICLKRFITACNLQAHMRIHTGEKPFECQYCGRRFSDRSSHLRHERIHTNEKPFQCKECGKAFSLATTLKKHLKVHTNERSYRCDICSKSFKLSHQLKAHKKSTLHRAIELVKN